MAARSPIIKAVFLRKCKPRRPPLRDETPGGFFYPQKYLRKESTMCEAAVYMVQEGKEDLVMESVDVLENDQAEVRMTDIFGEEKRLKARVKTLSLVDHKIFLEPLS
jgi:predicted RNA-binding protein